MMSTLSLNAGLQSYKDRKASYARWTAHALTDTQSERIHHLLDDITRLSERHFQSHSNSRSVKALSKKTLQGACLIGGSLVFYQNFLLARNLWSDELESKELITFLCLISLFPMIVYYLESSIRGSAGFFDLILCCFREEGEKTIAEKGFPKISKALQIFAAIVAILPQIQTEKIDDAYYNIDKPFGFTFMLSNIINTTLFIKMSFDDLINMFLEHAIDLKLSSSEIRELKMLQDDFNAYAEKIESKSLSEISDILDQLPNDSARDAIMKGIDQGKLNELIGLPHSLT